MDSAIQTYYGKVLERLIPELKRRNIDAVYCKDREEARVTVLGMIPAGSSVHTGGSVTLAQCGILDALLEGEYQYYRKEVEAARNDADRLRLRREATTADFCLGSLNAIAQTGEIVNIDGGGSRVGGYVFGADKVILVAGVNKITPTLGDALYRARHYAAIANSMREGHSAACSKDGVCHEGECYPPHRICGKTVIIEKESRPGRITVVFVGEELGY
ncbi:MAG: lactate utilization protein [Dehalococcoidia bacterium]|nr:lactate utilization protein [Dehalococcoidia bacterium]